MALCKLIFIPLMLLVSLLGGNANATSLTELSVDQMTDASDMVVRGVVTQVFSELDERGNIWTRAQVEVSDVLKGGDTQTVIVDQLGGVYGNQRSIISFATRFSVGEEAYLFIEQLGNGRNSVVGWFQGKFTVRMDPDSGREMVVRYNVTQDRVYDHRFIPHPEFENRVFAADLAEHIMGRVTNGWDGQAIPGTSMERLMRINAQVEGVQ
tara:strand:- start:375 stop:1004 length:630 start_codon:yes stop_codon:yes gene_type:complete